MTKKNATAKKPALYELTPEHRERFPEWRDKWIANAMRTGAYSETERVDIVTAMRGLYESAKLEAPAREIFVPSPMVGALATGIASGVWYLRENPGEHKKLFGCVLSEASIIAGMHAACAVADGRAPPVAAKITAATDAATSDATHAATRAATRAATSDATHAATDDATYAATHAATRAATDDATHDATYAATDAATGPVCSFLLGCALRWSNFYNGGNQWSGWTAYVSFFRHVAELKLDYSKWQHYEAATLAGPRFMHSKFWMVCSRPDVLRVDDENRPHCATGPSHRWPDGRELYYWRGTKIPGEWISDTKNVDPMLVLTHENVEQRRCLAEILGWTKVLAKLNPVVVDKHPNPEVGELLRLDPMPGTNEDPVGQFLKVRCGTGRTFVLRVSPNCKTALEAQGELFQLPPSVMSTLEVRT